MTTLSPSDKVAHSIAATDTVSTSVIPQTSVSVPALHLLEPTPDELMSMTLNDDSEFQRDETEDLLTLTKEALERDMFKHAHHHKEVFVCIAYTLASVRGHPYRSWLKYKTKIGNLKKKFNEVLISDAMEEHRLRDRKRPATKWRYYNLCWNIPLWRTQAETRRDEFLAREQDRLSSVVGVPLPVGTIASMGVEGNQERSDSVESGDGHLRRLSKRARSGGSVSPSERNKAARTDDGESGDDGPPLQEMSVIAELNEKEMQTLVSRSPDDIKTWLKDTGGLSSNSLVKLQDKGFMSSSSLEAFLSCMPVEASAFLGSIGTVLSLDVVESMKLYHCLKNKVDKLIATEEI